MRLLDLVECSANQDAKKNWFCIPIFLQIIGIIVILVNMSVSSLFWIWIVFSVGVGGLGRPGWTTLIVLFSLETLSFIWVGEDHYFRKIQWSSLKLKSFTFKMYKLISILWYWKDGQFKKKRQFPIQSSEDSNIRCYRKSLLTC